MRTSQTIFSGKTTSGKETFRQINQSTNAQDYILSKKNKTIASNIASSRKVKNYQDFYISKQQNNNNPKLSLFNNLKANKNNLVSGLYTDADLKNINIMATATTNISPAPVSLTYTPYTQYKLDPSGNLFGNNICGLNNIINYIDIS